MRLLQVYLAVIGSVALASFVGHVVRGRFRSPVVPCVWPNLLLGFFVTLGDVTLLVSQEDSPQFCHPTAFAVATAYFLPCAAAAIAINRAAA